MPQGEERFFFLKEIRVFLTLEMWVVVVVTVVPLVVSEVMVCMLARDTPSLSPSIPSVST